MSTGRPTWSYGSRARRLRCWTPYTHKLTLLARGLVFLGGELSDLVEPTRVVDTALRGLVDDEPVLQAHLRYQEKCRTAPSGRAGRLRWRR